MTQRQLIQDLHATMVEQTAIIEQQDQHLAEWHRLFQQAAGYVDALLAHCKKQAAELKALKGTR